MPASRKIIVRYLACDRTRMNRRFKTLKGAQRFAQERVGEAPEIGGWYAVSFDGIGRVTVEGATLEELFPKVAS